jgi:hypothetical protein
MGQTLRVRLIANTSTYNNNKYPLGTEIEVTEIDRTTKRKRYYFPDRDYYCYSEDFEIIGEEISNSGINFAQVAMGS